MAYKIANLLNFYRVTFSKLLGEESVLLESLATLEDSALHQFRALMRDHVVGLQADLQTAPPDLGPPEFLQEGLKQLTAIMRTYDSSFTPQGSRGTSFGPVLEEAFDPFMRACENISQRLGPPENAIFTINCQQAARSILGQFDFTTQRISSLQDSIEKQSAILIEYQYTFFREKSALQPLLDALAPIVDTQTDILSIRSLEPFKPEALTQASQTLDDFLPSALMDAMENLKSLQISTLAREITEEAATSFCTDFEQVEEKLVAADDAWQKDADLESLASTQPLRDLFPRTSGEIRVLLS